MESVQLLAEQSEVLGGHVLSIPGGDVLRDSGIIFAQDGLSSNLLTAGKLHVHWPEFCLFPSLICLIWLLDASNEEVQSFMSLPVHVLQDNSFVGPVLVKNAAGQTFLIDPRQVTLNLNAGCISFLINMVTFIQAFLFIFSVV